MDDRAFFKVEKIFGSLQSFRFFWKDFWLTTIFSVFVENIFGSLKSFQFFLSTYIILIVLLNSVNLSRKKEFPFEVFFNFWKDWNEQKKSVAQNTLFSREKLKRLVERPKNQFFQSLRYRYSNPTTEKETPN